MYMFRHEDFVIDLDNSNKTKLYKNGKLVFIGDGYKAITMLIRNAEDPGPVKEKFKAQLEMREKPKFEKQTDIETLRKEAAQEEEQRKAAEKKKKVIRRPSYR